MSFSSLYSADIARYTFNHKLSIPLWQRRFYYCLRKCQTVRNPITQLFFRYRFRKIKDKHGIELNYGTKIGGGLYLGHPYNITINADAVIGENCNIHKGVLIGQENRGKRKGAPMIGNNVWIGINACVVGRVTIGDDVLIAPNAFVNCDVPSHSIVFGNPCIVKHSDNATVGYINNTIGISAKLE